MTRTTGPLLVGLDIGSSSSKAVVCTADGDVLATGTRSAGPVQTGPEVAEYDADVLVSAALGAIRDAVECPSVDAREIVAISVSAMIAGIVGVDESRRPTTPYTTTLDTRFGPHQDRILAEAGSQIRRLTGSGNPTFGAKIAWLQELSAPGHDRTARYTTIAGLVLGELADLPAAELVVDHTHLWASGLASVVERRWEDALCSVAGISPDVLPNIVASGTLAGHLGRAAAQATGLPAGVPVVAGAGDQSAGFLAAGLTAPTLLADVTGTYPVVAACSATFTPDVGSGMIEIFPSVLEGLWHPVYFISGGGLTHDWLLALLDGAGIEDDTGLPMPRSDLVERAAALPPGSGDLLFIPHLGGLACPPDTAVRGAWFGLTWTHHPEHLYRAFLESIAYDELRAVERIQELYPDVQPRGVLVYGGGSKSQLWNQIRADVMGLPYRSLRRDRVALGAAILGGYGVGAFDDLAAAAARFSHKAEAYTVEPDSARHGAYLRYADLYGRTLDGLRPLFHDLATVRAMPSLDATRSDS